MNYKYHIFLFIFTSLATSQAHYTIPQNVWRLSYKQENLAGKWIGQDGSSGWRSYPYKVDSLNFFVTQDWRRKVSLQTLIVEYGFNDRSTFVLNIINYKKIEESHSWIIKGDSIKESINNLFNKYYPKRKSSSGIGDVKLGLNFLLKGTPVWRGGKSRFSVYSGMRMTIPYGQRLKKYSSKDLDLNGMPNQFKQLPIGTGLSEYELIFFGEFYRKSWGRLINLNWSAGVSNFSREVVNPPISFLWTQQTDADSISSLIGDVLYQKGRSLNVSILAQMEALPGRIFISAGMGWSLSARDQYFSKNNNWNSWMAKRTNYDTKKTYTRQYLKLNLLNLDPFKQVGPIPFELEVGFQWFVPLLTYNSYGNVSSWIGISTYFQAW